MTDHFARMECYLVANDPAQAPRHFEPCGKTTSLEQGYRRYATLFEQVRLVLNDDQATGRYLNYPHVCESSAQRTAVVSVACALRESASEAIFVGSTAIDQFPYELAVELVRQYDGEPFLGYYKPTEDGQTQQPLFGIYHKRLLQRLSEVNTEDNQALLAVLTREGKLVPLPDQYPGDLIGLE